MKILVFAHRLELGGTQANAIQLAANLRDRHGMQVVFHATPGPLQDMLKARKLDLVGAPDSRLHPSFARMRILRDLVRREQPDLIHAWDWWQGIEAYCAVNLPMQIPLIISDMQLTLTHLLPRHIPTTFGVSAVQKQAVQEGWQRSFYMPPSVDLTANAPGALDRAPCRSALGIKGRQVVIVAVSGLSHRVKDDSLARAIDSVHQMGKELPLRLIIVGDGAARADLQHHATRTNRHLRRTAVTLHGAMTDPRRAYAAADIVLGTGSSALTGMAFGKPVVVTGHRGFARIFDEGTAGWFSENSMHGVGDNDDGAAMRQAIQRLAPNASLRKELGAFGRSYVVQHHDLNHLTDQFAGICLAASDAAPPPSVTDAARSAVIYLRERRFRPPSNDRLSAPCP